MCIYVCSCRDYNYLPKYLPLQLADIGCVVHMCTLLHQRYAYFSLLLLQEFGKHFQGGIDKCDKVTT